MSANVEAKQNIGDIIKTYGGPNVPMTDLVETIKAAEDVKTVKFAWHPWMPIPNIGAEGFKFNVAYPVLDRLRPIPLPVFPYPHVKPRSSAQAFALLGATLAEAIPSAGSRAHIEQRYQMPSTSMEYLKTAYRRFGMTGLESMTATDERELLSSFVLYEAVMGVARDEEEAEAGRLPEGLVLEDYPAWLAGGAPRALSLAMAKGVTLDGRQFKLDSGMRARAQKLINEILAGVNQAHEMALNASDGLLPNTKKLLNITANHGQGGKNHLDALDEWLLKQFPSFRMDTDVERAQAALKETFQHSAQAAGANSDAILLIAQQNQAILNELVESRKQSNKMLEAFAKKTQAVL